MAIRRCPYCKAIIDEGSEYCSNCGTQLLFPEDENIQEEIPGEKIVEEEDMKEKPKKKRASTKRRRKEEEHKEKETVEDEGKEEIEEEAEAEEAALKEVEAEEEEWPIDEEETDGQREPVEEEVDQEDITAEVLKKAEMEKMETDLSEEEEEILEESRLEEEPSSKEEAEEENFNLPPGEGRDEYFVEEDKEASIKTEDLEKIIDPEEKEKAEIEKFLRSLREDRSKWGGEIPPTDELPPWAEEIKERQTEETSGKGADVESQDFVEPEEEQPAIEEKMEESPLREKEPQPQEVEQEKDLQEEDLPDQEELHPDELSPEEKTPDVEIPLEEIEGKTPLEKEISVPDTRMGLPEGVEQEKLPFDEKPGGLFKEEERKPFIKVPNWVKSRAFDVLFIAAMWIVTIHIASRMMATNLFRLISVAILPVFAFYLVLLGVYLFLFFLFLGQTLGDHLFPHEE